MVLCPSHSEISVHGNPAWPLHRRKAQLGPSPGKTSTPVFLAPPPSTLRCVEEVPALPICPVCVCARARVRVSVCEHVWGWHQTGIFLGHSLLGSGACLLDLASLASELAPGVLFPKHWLYRWPGWPGNQRAGSWAYLASTYPLSPRVFS